MPNRFKINEVVNIRSSDPDIVDVNGMEGIIIDLVESENNMWRYEVAFDELEEDHLRMIDETDLIFTGKTQKREVKHTGDSIRVRPDGSVVRKGE